MATYSPNPLDPTQPTSSIDAGTLPVELRAIKGKLVEFNQAKQAQDQTNEAFEEALEELSNSMRAVTRFAILTSTVPTNWVVPAEVEQAGRLLVIAIGGGQGGQGGYGRVRAKNLSNDYYQPPVMRGRDGLNGQVEVRVLTGLSAGQQIPYACGVGGAGGEARNDDRIPDINLDHGFWERDRTAMEDDSTETWIYWDRRNDGGADDFARLYYTKFTDIHGSYGEAGSPTVFNTGAANEVLAEGGGVDFSPAFYDWIPQNQISVGLLAPYGMGGAGGLSRMRVKTDPAGVIRNSQDGVAGMQGAILLLW